MTVDLDAAEKKRLKKEKKEKKRLAALAAQNLSSGEAEVTEELEDAGGKKKRKHNVEEDVDDTEKQTKKRKKDLTEDEKKEKAERKEKKKRRKQEDAQAAIEPSSESATEFLTKNNITLSTPITPILSFSSLSASYNVPQKLQDILQSRFQNPTPIQSCTWPPALQHKDVVGIAETGSGKTFAFGVPALSRIIASSESSGSVSPGITTLIVAPTRELALQTHDNLTELATEFGIGSIAVFGGVSRDEQIKTLKAAASGKKNKKAQDGVTTKIIVGTPGRIIDLINDGACDLSGVDYLVLDEADRMLDKGFEKDIRKIISYTKQGVGKRQTMMFSATWPEAVRKLAENFQHEPVRITVGSEDLTANSRVEQLVEVIEGHEKNKRLLHHLNNLLPKKSNNLILIFVLYKNEVPAVLNLLTRGGNKYSVGAIHGDMNQAARLESLQSFKNGTKNILIATDVAARGLDIPNVTAVINYSFPLLVEDYVHRIGRTGRGGLSGKSVTFFTGDGHERGLAGELARVLHDGGFECPDLVNKFPMTIKKKTHSAYGAFFRDDIPQTERKKIVF